MDIKILKKKENNKKLMDEDDMDKLLNFLCENKDNNVSNIFNSIDEILPHLKTTDDNLKIEKIKSFPHFVRENVYHRQTEGEEKLTNKKYINNIFNYFNDLNNSITHLIKVLNKLL